MNCKTEAKRLAGSRKMEKPTFERDIEMALENAVAKAIETIKIIEGLSRKRIGLRLPKDKIVEQINQVANDYLGVK